MARGDLSVGPGPSDRWRRERETEEQATVDEQRWRGGTYQWGLARVIGAGASDGDEAVDERRGRGGTYQQGLAR